MGLFSKKDPCPICGGEVKGRRLVKIAEKQTLCESCSRQISMSRDLLETATPEFIWEHLDYRQQNAEKYASLHWTVKSTGIPGFKMGMDEKGKAIYLVHDSLQDLGNPVVFSFDQITGYELFRGRKKLDGLEDTGAIPLATGISVLGPIARFESEERSARADCFHLKLTTTDPYWKVIDLKIDFTDPQLYGLGGFAGEMKQVCQIIKCIIRGKPIYYAH